MWRSKVRAADFTLQVCCTLAYETVCCAGRDCLLLTAPTSSGTGLTVERGPRQLDEKGRTVNLKRCNVVDVYWGVVAHTIRRHHDCRATKTGRFRKSVPPRLCGLRDARAMEHADA